MSRIICRACLQSVDNPSDAYSLDTKEGDQDSLTLGAKLAQCVPELMDIPSVPLVLCWACTVAVRCAYGFRQQCLEAETRIRDYVLNKNCENLTDLNQVVDDAPELQNQISISLEETIIEDDVVEVCDENETTEEGTVTTNSEHLPHVSTLENLLTSREYMDVNYCNSINKILNTDANSAHSNKNNLLQTNQYDSRGLYATSLLKSLLSNHLFVCPKCSYQTNKFNRYQLHQRTHSVETNII